VGGSPRLLHFADYGASYPGSFIPMVASLARGARDRGWSVELVFSELSRGRPWVTDLEAAGHVLRFVDVGRRDGPRRWATASATELTGARWRDRLTRAVCDLLAEAAVPTVMHTQFSAFDIAAAEAARTVPGTAVVWHEQAGRVTDRLATLRGLIRYRLIAQHVREIVCCAPGIADAIERLGAATQVSVLPNPVDTRWLRPPSADERARVRDELGVRPDTPMILHFGGHWTRKGGDIYLSAIRTLLDEGIEVQAFTVGADDARAAVRSASLNGHVTVLDPTDRLRDLYAASDVFVSPSRSEGMPFAIWEALAMEVPVVATDIPGQTFIGQRVSACRLTPVDAQHVAGRVRELLELDAGARGRETATARAWIEEHLAVGAWTDAMLDKYERALVDQLGGTLGERPPA
jgi:glycosyltransferase involved in cell wall biosynthesis